VCTCEHTPTLHLNTRKNRELYIQDKTSVSDRGFASVYAIDEATTAIPTSVLAGIKRNLEDKYDCASEEERDIAMRQPQDFQDGEVGLMVKLGYTKKWTLRHSRRNKVREYIFIYIHTHTRNFKTAYWPLPPYSGLESIAQIRTPIHKNRPL